MKVMAILGLAAIGAVFAVAAPGEQAQAMSLINPGAAATVQDNSNLVTEAGWHHRWHHRHWHHRHWHPRHWHHRHWHHR